MLDRRLVGDDSLWLNLRLKQRGFAERSHFHKVHEGRQCSHSTNKPGGDQCYTQRWLTCASNGMF